MKLGGKNQSGSYYPVQHSRSNPIYIKKKKKKISRIHSNSFYGTLTEHWTSSCSYRDTQKKRKKDRDSFTLFFKKFSRFIINLCLFGIVRLYRYYLAQIVKNNLFTRNLRTRWLFIIIGWYSCTIIIPNRQRILKRKIVINCDG